MTNGTTAPGTSPERGARECDAANEFPVRQEEDHVATPALATAAIVALATAAVAVSFAGLVLVWTSGSLRPDEAGRGGPREVPRTVAGIEQTPIETTAVGLEQRRSQTRELESWGWADRDAGLARIPIDRAIDLVVSESRR